MTDDETAPRPIDRLLDRERLLLQRLDPRQAEEAVRAGGVIVDTRSHEQRVAGGIVPGSIRVHRNVLEWRGGPTPAWFGGGVAPPPRPAVGVCGEGCSSCPRGAPPPPPRLLPAPAHGRRGLGLRGRRRP